MARFTFFLGADLGQDADLSRQILLALNDARKDADFPEHFTDLCSTLNQDREECQEAIDEGVACGEAAQDIYELVAESDIMDIDEAQEALTLTLFEGGSLNPDLRLLSLNGIAL